MTIGEQIRSIRKYHDLTQKQLAEFARIAVVTLQQYESGKRQPRLEQLQRIAGVFGGSVEDIFELERPDLCLDPMDIKNAKLFTGIEGLEHIWNKEKRIVNELNKLNEEGKDKAIEHVEMLAKIPEYRKDDDKKEED